MTIWRIAYILIIVFWLGMTGLLVRQTYFPPDDGLLSVSPQMVLQRLSQHSDYINSLTLLRGKEKLGHAAISAKLWVDQATDQPKGYTLQAGGMIEGKTWDQPEFNVSWSFTGRLDETEHWQLLDLRLRSPISAVVFIWEKGMEQPKIEVHQNGKMIMDTQALMAQAKTAAMLPGLSALSMLGNGGNQKQITPETAIKLTAKQGWLMLANQRRKGFQLTFNLLDLAEARAMMTETGELARVELPQQMELQDPIIFGIQEQEARSP